MAGPNETLTLTLNVTHDQFLRALDQVDGRLANLAKTITIVTGVSTALLAGREIAQGFDQAISSAIDYESRLSQVRKTTGLTGIELENLRQKLAGLSTTLGGMSYESLLQIAVMGGRLGVAGDKVADFARDVGMITVALDDIPAEEAATRIGRILYIFHLGTENAINFASALNRLDDTSTATGRDILDITQRISGPAATLGLAPQKLLALSTALKDAGINNEVAGTAMTQVLSRMATAPEQFAQVAGVSMNKFARMMRADPLLALVEFERGLKRLSGPEQFQVLDQMGLRGARVKTSMLQLAQIIDKIPGYVKTAEGEWNSLASILRENEIAGNTTAAQLEKLRNGWMQLTLEVGNLGLPIIRALATAMGRVSGNLKEVIAANKDWLSGMFAPIEKAISYTGLLVTHWREFVELGKQFALEKFEQLVVILDRIRPVLSENMRTLGMNALTVFEHLFAGLGAYVQDMFSRIGPVIVEMIKRPFLQMMVEITDNPVSRLAARLTGGEKAVEAFEIHLARMRRQLAMPLPPIVAPDAGPLAVARERILGGVGMLTLPGGFGGVFQNLPNRDRQMAPILQNLGQAQQGLAEEEAARKARLQPRPAAPNPFQGMTAGQLQFRENRLKGRLAAARANRKKAAAVVRGKGRGRLATAQPNFVGPQRPGSPEAALAAARQQEQAILEIQKQIRQARAEAMLSGRRRGGLHRGVGPQPPGPLNARAQVAADRANAERGALPNTALARPNAATQNARQAERQQRPMGGVPAPNQAGQAKPGPNDEAMMNQMGGMGQSLGATQANVARLAAKQQQAASMIRQLQSQARQTAMRLQENLPTNTDYGYA
jgi:TP901 family phage tail tape measure protein